MVFSGAPTTCSGCHEDVHLGQFDEPERPVECGRCHTVAAWRPVLFEHDRDSRFTLEGAHARVSCESCHKLEGADERLDGERTFVRYKPLPTACAECHGEKEDG